MGVIERSDEPKIKEIAASDSTQYRIIPQDVVDKHAERAKRHTAQYPYGQRLVKTKEMDRFDRAERTT